MTDRTDLTENRDFRGPSEVVINRILADEAFELANERGMSTEEFEKVFAWEQIFGRKYHYSEELDVFRDNKKWMEEMQSHCQRCGKEFRMPWKKVFDLCEECNYILNTGIGGRYKKFPWSNPEVLQSASFREEDPMHIFSLR